MLDQHVRKTVYSATQRTSRGRWTVELWSRIVVSGTNSLHAEGFQAQSHLAESLGLSAGTGLGSSPNRVDPEAVGLAPACSYATLLLPFRSCHLTPPAAIWKLTWDPEVSGTAPPWPAPLLSHTELCCRGPQNEPRQTRYMSANTQQLHAQVTAFQYMLLGTAATENLYAEINRTEASVLPPRQSTDFPMENTRFEQ